MMNTLYKGFVITKDKKSTEPFKNKTSEELRTYEEVQSLPEYAGIIADDYVLVDIDDSGQAELVLKIVEAENINTHVVKTTRGMHFYFKDDTAMLDRNHTNATTTLGVKIDVKRGLRNSYAILKFNDKDRPIVRTTDKELDSVPIWLKRIQEPTRSKYDLTLSEGNRNQTLMTYIIDLEVERISTENIKEIIKIINRYVLKNPLDNTEIDSILRDENFGTQANGFLNDKGNFEHHLFGDFIIEEYHIKLIEHKIHIYSLGEYIVDDVLIRQAMLKKIPSLRKSSQDEVLNYINTKLHETDGGLTPSVPHLISFNNGILNVKTDEFIEHDPKYLITNKIPHNYNPSAKSEIVKDALTNFANEDSDIRKLLQETAGATLYRKPLYDMSFITVGNKRNGKSTYFQLINDMLGEKNRTSLDIGELDQKFKASQLYRKLANVGDDINDEKINKTSTFKKLVTGEPVNVEEKNKDPFDLSSYATFLFSANTVPIVNDPTGAVLRRLCLIPFDNYFDVNDPKNIPNLRQIIRSEEHIEYFILEAIEGLKRVLKNERFTESQKVHEAMSDYKIDVNPIEAWLESLDVSFSELASKHEANFIYAQFIAFCETNNIEPTSMQSFSKDVRTRLRYKSVQVRASKVNGFAEQYNLKLGTRFRIYQK